MKKSKHLITSSLIILFQLGNTFCFAQLISAGNVHTLAVCNDGTGRAWGNGGDGAIGSSSATTFNKLPIPINTLTAITCITAGMYNSGAVVNDTVWTWGRNSHGELGNGTITPSNVPIQVTSLSNVVSLSAGEEHFIALKHDGTVWSWGFNNYGQLGNGTNIESHLPIQVTSLSGIIAIAAGQQGFSLALKNDGTVWSWGNNNHGQLGDGTVLNSNIPVQVSSLTNVISIAGGGEHSLAAKSDGTAWAWGNGSGGRLGNGSSLDSHIPVQVSSLINVTQVAGGNLYSLALSDSTVWAWGNNFYGQYGDGSTTGSGGFPVQTNILTHVTAISAGYAQSMALKKDSTVWTWGYNIYGQLGIGTTVDAHLPTLVSGLCPVATPSNCFAHYTAEYDSVLNSFNLDVDIITQSMAVGYHWDFGDGTTSALIAPSHVYTVDTVYDVCMTIYKASGDSCTYCHTIGKDYLGNIIRTSGFTINVNNSGGATTGVTATENATQISIFPNPSNGVFNISTSTQLKNASIEVYNSIGAMVYKQKIITKENTIELREQSKGLYFVKVMSDGEVVGVKKIVKE